MTNLKQFTSEELLKIENKIIERTVRDYGRLDTRQWPYEERFPSFADGDGWTLARRKPNAGKYQ